MLFRQKNKKCKKFCAFFRKNQAYQKKKERSRRPFLPACGIKMGVLNEYEEVLIGQKKQISPNYFSMDKAGNERVAITVIRYALETLLGWSVQDAIRMFRPEYIGFMHLDQAVQNINFPCDVPHDDTEYILYLLYPKRVDYNVKKYTIRIYESVLKGESRYPKDYMYGWIGMLRAKICLQYALNKDKVFKSVDGLYRFFASKEGRRYLKKAKLHQLYTSFFDTPLDFMHNSMPRAIKNEFLYHNYKFLQRCAETLPLRVLRSLPQPQGKTEAEMQKKDAQMTKTTAVAEPKENAFLQHNRAFLEKYRIVTGEEEKIVQQSTYPTP